MVGDQARTEHLVANIDPSVPPSGEGCVDCLATPDGWWVHLRRCAKCGHVGCCDSSPHQHARAHAHATGHDVIQSFEPQEGCLFSYSMNSYVTGPELAPPRSHPADWPVPGPADRVPPNWRELLP